jgi:uncharacterized protein YndB with AHSA1/START domain
MQEKRNSSVTDLEKRELTIIRFFDAPVKLVWKAWTEPEHFKKWWGPKNYTAPACKMDFKVGSKYHFCMQSPDGKDFWSTGVYREIVPRKKIVFTDSFADEKGNVVPASYYEMPGEDWPLETTVTVAFEENGGKTKMTLKHVGIPVGEMKEMTGVGWNESFDKLADSFK